MSGVRSERVEAMALRYARGEPLHSIGADFGVSKEAVRQLLLRRGYVTPGAGSRARRAQARQADAERRVEILAELERSPVTLTRAEAAQRFGLSPARVSELLGEDAFRVLKWPSVRPSTFTDEDILAGLRTVAGALGTATLTRAGYDAARRDHGQLASGVRVIQRFGSWSAAVDRAGLTAGRGRPVYANHRSLDELLSYLVAYVGEAESFSLNEYSRLARERGWPSGSFIRSRFGSWNQAKSAAVAAAAKGRTTG
jgi:hypothetical protein